jgi:hypothetical protein
MLGITHNKKNKTLGRNLEGLKLKLNYAKNRNKMLAPAALPFKLFTSSQPN